MYFLEYDMLPAGKRIFLLSVSMHRQIRIHYLERCHSLNKQETLYFLETFLSPFLQFPKSMLSILMDHLKESYDFPEWKNLADKPVMKPSILYVNGIKRPRVEMCFREILWSGYERWRGSDASSECPPNVCISSEDVWQQIKEQTNLDSEVESANNKASFLLALLAESFYRDKLQMPWSPKFAAVFEKQETFMNFLKSLFPESVNCFSTRVSFLYYVFESLRLYPSLSYCAVGSEKWESMNPVTNLWESFRFSHSRVVMVDSTCGKEFLKFMEGIESAEGLGVWRYILRTPIFMPNLSAFPNWENSFGSNFKSYFNKRYALWRGYTLPPAQTQFTRKQVLSAIQVLTAKTDTNPPCISLLMAIVAETLNKEYYYDCNEFRTIFEGHSEFVAWMDCLAGKSNRNLICRIAKRYFILESLRLSPELSQLAAGQFKWNSPQPVEVIQQVCLKLINNRSVPTFGSDFLEFVKRPEIEGFTTWNHIIHTPVRVSNLENFQDASFNRIRYILHRDYDRWRGYLPSNVATENQSVAIQMLDLMQVLDRHLKNNVQSPGPSLSLLLAVLAEMATHRKSFSTSVLEKFAVVFANHPNFTSWLNSVPASSNQSLSDRIAYRYYILECLRNFPELSRLISTECGWESPEPVREIWDTCLNKWCPPCSSSKTYNTYDGERLGYVTTDFNEFTSFNQSTNSGQELIPLIRLQFLHSLMKQVPPSERRKATLEAWDKVLIGESLHTAIDEKMDNRWKLLSNFCSNFDVSDCCQLERESDLKERESQHQLNDGSPWHTAMEMLTETGYQWESPEWSLLLSIGSLYRTAPNCHEHCQFAWAVQRPISKWLEDIESGILNEKKTILEQVLFRYFALLCLLGGAIREEDPIMLRNLKEDSTETLKIIDSTVLRDLWEFSKIESILDMCVYRIDQGHVSITRGEFRQGWEELQL
eukprot:Gregarina_sp_Poly_1__7664@NODE_430_length_8539_cov_26_113314_g351_i0_p1_GENE_NODE_430_length_8539_cov_26_113314_g351_i0NODE_430_length_8539_cov_26_113314_g351_i0_p1_ORF_typecomplete_len935_score131_25TEA/PF01285_18/1TEA/PF01285_18/1_3e03_NODE_430_length_8539_cov_26_113314_g351_i021954999